MGDATREQFLQVLRTSLDVLGDAEADHLLMGGLAAAIQLERAWDPGSQDIDLFIRERDAERILEHFGDAGYATRRYDERWIYKVARPNVTVDLIFRAAERILLDDEHLARAVPAQLDGVPVRMLCPVDLAVEKAIFDSVERPTNWHAAVCVLARGSLDWDYLVRRARQHGPERLLSLLLYAATDGVDVPDDVLAQVRDVAFASARRRE